jgi:acetyl esterase/lipase
MIVLPGGGYAEHAAHEAEPVAQWLRGLGVESSVFRYPLNVRHPAPLEALQAEIRRLRGSGAETIGLLGLSAGGHLAGLAALAPHADPQESVQFAVLGYAITSMETETYRPARLILLGEDASPELRRSTSLDSLVAPSSPPFFVWHTAEDSYVPPEHTYRFATALAANNVPHTVHVFAHGPHSLGLAQGAGEASTWPRFAAAWIGEHIGATDGFPED